MLLSVAVVAGAILWGTAAFGGTTDPSDRIAPSKTTDTDAHPELVAGDDQQHQAGSHADPRLASAQLEQLVVKAGASKADYDREAQFGEPWFDLDGNGCDTRNDILARDLTVTKLSEDGCTVLAGSFFDPYTGSRVDFQYGEKGSQLVQIEHVVSLSDSWQTGAQALSADQRLALANDPLNLVVVDRETNLDKKDSDAASWLPPNPEFRCEYVSRQIEVKKKYSLWVTPAEHDAMAKVLSDC